jgi:uncharacterized protein YdaT
MANQHVVPNNGQWQLKREGSNKATKNFTTQKQAIDYARPIAMNQHSELVIHGCNGQIRDKDSYGNDPCPPKDKKY